MISTLLTITIAGLMFWQPSFERDYRPAGSYKPTKKEEYINKVTNLLRDKNYVEAISFLQKLEYTLGDERVPLIYWRSLVSERINEIRKESERLKDLSALENILNG